MSTGQFLYANECNVCSIKREYLKKEDLTENVLVKKKSF